MVRKIPIRPVDTADEALRVAHLRTEDKLMLQSGGDVYVAANGETSHEPPDMQYGYRVTSDGFGRARVTEVWPGDTEATTALKEAGLIKPLRP